MTQEEIVTSVLEKYGTIKSGDVFHIASLENYLQELVDSKDLYNFKVQLDGENLYVHIRKRKHSKIRSFEVKQYFREQRLRKLLNNEKYS